MHFFFSIGSLQSCRGYSWADWFVQEASQTFIDGELLPETWSCLLEIWKSVVSCLHTAQNVSLVKRTEKEFVTRRIAEVNKTL